MKNLNLFALTLLIIFSSCSKDDSTPNQVIPKDDGIATSYFPNKVNNLWTYKTENTSVNPNVIGEDLLFEEKEVQMNGFTYQKMKTKSLPTGFYCGALENNALRVDGKMIKLTGDLSLNLGESVPVNFSVSDFVFFKENATPSEEFGIASGTITNTTALPDYPLTITYILKAQEAGSLTTYTSNDVNYTDVKKVKLILLVKVSSEIIIPNIGVVPLNALDVNYTDANGYQNLLISYQYYAKSQGMIKAETTVEYHLNPILASESIPVTATQTTNDYLVSILKN